MSFYKISQFFFSKSRIISPLRYLQPARFKLLKQRQQPASFHTSSQRYTSDPFLVLNSGPYSVAHSTPQPAHLQKVFNKSLEDSKSKMMISQSQGSLLTILCRLLNVNRALELGGYMGYSALCLAEGVKGKRTNAKVISCESNEEYAAIALQNVKEAGMNDYVEIRIGKALDTLQSLERSTCFDLIFIDANKSGYVDYYETILEHNLLSERGIIVADNVLFRGYVEKMPHYDSKAPESSENYIPEEFYKIAKNLHRFNEHVTKDPRTTNLLLPGFDGLMLIQKSNRS